MPETFGARLRRRREEQHIALGAIADQTKIKLSLLEALERDDVSHWPSGIFRRAYIRAYAHAIGLSPDGVVREFLEAFPEPAEDVVSAFATAGSESGRGGARTRLRHLVSSALGSLSRSSRAAPLETPQAIGSATNHPGSEPGLQASLETWRERGLVEGTTGVVYEDRVHVTDLLDPALEPDEGLAHESAVVGPEEHSATSDSGETISEASSHAGREAEAVRAGDRAAAPPDLLALADLCTDLGRVESADDLELLLDDASRILDAQGLIVWLWDHAASVLRPALVHGYSDQVIAQLPPVTHDADNATAAAFRLAQACTIAGSGRTSGALVVPLLTPAGCVGVLALELRDGREQSGSSRAAATIVASLLSQLVGGASAADGLEREAMRPAVGEPTTPVLRVNVRSDGQARVPIR
jgi:transcriptional regulator with XRE-family HTH domain